MKKYVLGAIIGMGFGFPITLLCMTLFGEYTVMVRDLLIWMVASALYGLLSVIMDSKKYDMPMPVSFGLHFLGIVVITMCATLLCGYITRIVDVLLILAPTIVIYNVICFICFLLMKKDEKQINKALEEK